ncbi:oxidoreductase [Catellatospora methionotrophica]|uniref:Oxidoreductase n=1 Tax=Catellatospora methionotrophica TaxID=121620 RepID=A0A8J3LNW2_9ACTN|nr:aldo/keto reductase [Catellatospora methionotrophica]GIG18726.1 oxidoreductase [Catellatospora methionotrophica]
MPTPLIDATSAGTFTLGDLTVNRIGFGAMRLPGGENYGYGSASDRDRVIGVLRQAVALGVNHIDTAAFYFSPLRSANELINRALAPYAGGLVIAAKVGPGRDPSGDWLPLARPDQLRGQVEENLRQLGRDHLDLVYLRQHGLESVAEHFGALAELRDAGLIRHLGLSNIRPQHLAQAQAVAPVVSVQNPYGVDTRRMHDGLVRTCGEQGVAFVPFFSVAGEGRESGGVARNDAVQAIAQAHGATAAQVRIAWTLSRGPHTLAIPGTGNPDHLVENIAAGALRLSAQELASLE